MIYQRLQSDSEWARERVDPLHHRWQNKLLDAWHQAREHRESDHWTAENEAHRKANLQLLDMTEQLQKVRIKLDASDTDVCQRAFELAEYCAQLAQIFHQPEALRSAMERTAYRNDIEPPNKKTETAPAIARMTDPIWWRRALRKLHAKSVEGAAISLGYVNKTRDIYVSNESLRRRGQQNKRNAEALEATIAINELGQEYTLAELAAVGTANKAIRRAELMTRISGFERIARDLGHAGLFFTMTCPSRMHKWRTVAGARVIENPRYDGTTPREAQGYLAKVWARIRAKFKRDETGLYGFRIAEPNHDGTPHWHFLIFHRQDHYETMRATITRYALKDSPNEPGAHTHRVDFKPIDWKRGTAAGYIAKYVAKNIDGYKLDKDLFGNDALETSARVEAWAATWGIRQFQQVGGPPVGPWRELRRVESVPENAPHHLKLAHQAVNKTAVFEGRENASVAWDHYCKAQGGVFCGRGYSICISTIEREGLGRYGEPLPPEPVGVETASKETYTPAHMVHMGGKAERVVTWFVESKRHQWQIITRRGGNEGKPLGATRPWTCVNNCTEQKENGNDRSSKGAHSRRFNPVGQSPNAHSSHGGRIHDPNSRSPASHWPGTGPTTGF